MSSSINNQTTSPQPLPTNENSEPSSTMEYPPQKDSSSNETEAGDLVTTVNQAPPSLVELSAEPQPDSGITEGFGNEGAPVPGPETDEDPPSSNCCWYQFTNTPYQVTGSWSDFKMKKNNFLKGCKWSPDGTCLLTCSNDNRIRVYNLPSEILQWNFSNLSEMKCVVEVNVGETVYDYCWYPNMSASEHDTCLFLTSSRDHPIQCWNAFTGKLVFTYRPINSVDEVEAPHCICFRTDGSKIYSGFKKVVRIFDTDCPGRKFQVVRCGLPGIISCVASSPTEEGIYAAGSFCRSIVLCSESMRGPLAVLDGHVGGLTHIKFSPDGTKLFSGGRKDPYINSWDLRMLGKHLSQYQRTVITNQRIYFDIDSTGQYLISGNQDGFVSVWDLSGSRLSQDVIPSDMDRTSSALLPVLHYQAHADTVNGVSFNPFVPVTATSSGQRHYDDVVSTMSFPSDNSSESETETMADSLQDNSLRLWWNGPIFWEI